MYNILFGMRIVVYMNEHINVHNHHSRHLSQLQDEIVYGGYLAALCSPSFVFSVSILSNIKVNLPILAIAYLIPLIVYSYDYYHDINKDMATNFERATQFNKKAKIYPFIMASYVILLLLLLILFSNYKLILFILTTVLVGMLYTFGFKSFTKKIPGFKNVYTALTWAIAGTFFIPLYYSMDLNITFMLIFLFIFLKCLPNIIFFDIKDIEGDKKEGLKTVPVLIGKENALNLLRGMNIIAFLPLFAGVYFHLIPAFTMVMLVFLAYSFHYMKKTSKASADEISAISQTLADAEFILWPLVLFAASSILKILIS